MIDKTRQIEKAKELIGMVFDTQNRWDRGSHNYHPNRDQLKIEEATINQQRLASALMLICQLLEVEK